jgi:hypothetical protein
VAVQRNRERRSQPLPVIARVKIGIARRSKKPMATTDHR